MKIIPAIDLIDGKCVRLSKGDYATSKIYNENPLEVAKMLADNGIQYLHLVDLDGAKSNKVVNHKTLYEIASKTNLTIDFGGGIKSTKDVEIALDAGANQLNIGSIAVHNKSLMLEWLSTYGASKIILSADCKNSKIATHGWVKENNIDVVDFIQDYQKEGVQHCVVTDIEKDGMLNGPSYALYKTLLANTTVELIASGGITTMEDLHQLKSMGCKGAIIGKAIYEGTITMQQIQELC